MAGKNGRRPNGDGTVYYNEARERWMGQISLDNGRRKTIYGRTQREVTEKMRAMARDRDRGLPVAQERQTVESYLTHWLESKRAEGIRAKTYYGYRDAITLHLVPHLGRLQLTKLKAGHIETMCAALLDEGLSAQTVRGVHSVLRNALEKAVLQDTLPRNVAKLAKPPKVAKRAPAVWTPEQWHTFRELHAEDRLTPLYTLAVNTCTRLGELLALQWERDVDLTCGTITVQSGRQMDWDRTYTAGNPKTPAGTRTIHLTDDASEALKEQRRRQNAERLKRGRVWQDHDLVFASTVGTMLDHSNVEHRWKKIVAASGLPFIRIHDLRHTGASLLLSQGMNPLIVSHMLGHADPATTLRVYGHVMPTEGARAAEAMQRAMDSGRKKTGAR